MIRDKTRRGTRRIGQWMSQMGQTDQRTDRLTECRNCQSCYTQLKNVNNWSYGYFVTSPERYGYVEVNDDIDDVNDTDSWNSREMFLLLTFSRVITEFLVSLEKGNF